MDIKYGIYQGISEEQIDLLIDAGVTEFFLGFMSKPWLKKLGFEVSPNKRTNMGDNFTDYSKFKEAIEYVKQKGEKAYLALNDFQYTSDQLKLIKKDLAEFEDVEPDGYIISDPSLLLEFETMGIKEEIHAGVCTGCFNHYAVNFFSQFKGVKRLTLPRYLTLDEIRSIKEKSKLDLECFAISGGCSFGEESCFTFHSSEKEIFCNREYHLKDITGTKNKPSLAPSFRSSESVKCGKCSSLFFKNIGIKCIKFPARGHESLMIPKLREIDTALKSSKGVNEIYERCKNKEMCAYDLGVLNDD